MTLIYILLPLFGALPLLIILFRMRNARRIKTNGIATEAVVAKITLLPRSVASLVLEYVAELKGEQFLFKGKATATAGQYKLGDTIPIYYLPDNPYKMSLQNQQGFKFLLVFTIIIFLFILFATFQMEELMM